MLFIYIPVYIIISQTRSFETLSSSLESSEKSSCLVQIQFEGLCFTYYSFINYICTLSNGSSCETKFTYIYVTKLTSN